jgi:hypothetical protein
VSTSTKKGGTVKFSRNGGSGGRHSAEEPRRSSRHSRQVDGANVDASGFDDESATSGAERPQAAGRRIVPAALDGPYDIADAPTGVTRVDLGSLQIPSVEGVEVRVQANAEGVIQQVVLGHEGSALQLAVFAAPRTEGIWDEVREEIRKSLFDDGVAAEEVDGDYGAELRARVRNPEGTTDMRFIGVDGPRWMLRVVYVGPAAVNPAASGPLVTCLRGLVVDRGRDAMPVREALPLRLPREIEEAARAHAAAAAGGQVAAPAAQESVQVSAPEAQPQVNGVRKAPTGNVYGGGTYAGPRDSERSGNDAGRSAQATDDGGRDNPAGRRPSPRPRRSE